MVIAEKRLSWGSWGVLVPKGIFFLGEYKLSFKKFLKLFYLKFSLKTVRNRFSSYSIHNSKIQQIFNLKGNWKRFNWKVTQKSSARFQFRIQLKGQSKGIQQLLKLKLFNIKFSLRVSQKRFCRFSNRNSAQRKYIQQLFNSQFSSKASQRDLAAFHIRIQPKSQSNKIQQLFKSEFSSKEAQNKFSRFSILNSAQKLLERLLAGFQWKRYSKHIQQVFSSKFSSKSYLKRYSRFLI